MAAHLRRLLLAGAALLAAAGAVSAPLAADEPAPPSRAGEAGGTASRREEAAEAAARRRFARALSFDLRGRGPSPAEAEDAARFTGPELVDRMLTDPAIWEAWLDRELWYYLLIDRFRPVSDRVLALPGRLAFGACTAKDATREIVVSAEFNVRNPGNDTFVTVVLEQLLGMVVQDSQRVLDAGKKMYDGYATRLFGELGRSQADVVRIVLDRREFADAFIARQYRQFFGTAIPREVLARDGARFHAEPASFTPILREWLLSPEYAARTRVPRPKDDLCFIRTLFVDLLGREPGFEEFRNSRNALLALSDPTPVRHVLAQLLLDSPGSTVPSRDAVGMPAAWVRSRFLALLGREPTEAERDAFVATLGEYGCEPRTLVMALVTSAEYQYY